MTRSFASDNGSGIHPRILESIAEANSDHTSAYGDDPWTAAACERINQVFDCDAKSLFCFGGTGANVVALSSMIQAYEAVICADSAHVWNSEGGAPERFTGAKLIPVPATLGKLDCNTIASYLGPGRGVHQSVPRVLTITQPTEYGTLYTPDEMRELADFVHSKDMLLHVDGARFANALAASDQTPAMAGPGAGIDVLSLGGTKNGLMGAEAVVYFRPELADQAEHARKQAMQLASKMRFLAAQFLAYFDDELWLKLAGKANHMAARLHSELAGEASVRFIAPVECNMLFAALPPTALSALHELQYFYTWDEASAVARWISSFDTTEEDVSGFASDVRRALTMSS